MYDEDQIDADVESARDFILGLDSYDTKYSKDHTRAYLSALVDELRMEISALEA